MILVAAVLGAAWGLYRSGYFSSIFKKHFRMPILLFLSLGVEFLLKSNYLHGKMADWPAFLTIRTVMAAAQYLLVLTFLFRNRFKPGMSCLMTGSVMNGLAIVLNGGRMPIGSLVASIPGFGAEAIARISSAPHYFLAVGGEPFLWFADLIPFWTFGFYMISIGDIILSIGAFRLAAYMPRRIVRPRKPTFRSPTPAGRRSVQ